jgi:hypothetical protein
MVGLASRRVSNAVAPEPLPLSRCCLLYGRGNFMLKAVGWIVLIIFIIGLLVVLGVFKAIF